jgi:hypothetical protein
MDIVLNFLSDLFHAYWFYVAWGAFWGIVSCLVEVEDENDKKQFQFKLSFRKPIASAQEIWKRRRNSQTKYDQALEEDETKQTKLSIRKPISSAKEIWKRRPDRQIN